MPVIKHLALLPILFHCGMGFSNPSIPGQTLKPRNALPDDVPFELYSYCGENSVPVSKKQAQENLKKIPQNLSQSIRNAVRVPDEAWYEISGVYDRIRETYGIDVKIAKNAQDLNRIRVDTEVQSKLNEIARARGLESHEVLQDQMIDYLDGKMSLPDLLAEASCTLTENLMSCISRREDLAMKITGAETKILSEIQSKIVGSPKKDGLIPIFKPNEESNELLPVATIDFQLNRMNPKLAQELKEDFALFNMSKFLAGRECVLTEGKLSCMLSEAEAKASGRKWVDISAASFDAYGVTIGHNAAEKQKALQELFNRNRNGFDKNDPRWFMHGGLDPTCMTSGCHQSGKFVKVAHSWTGKDRFKSILNGAAVTGGIGAAAFGGVGTVSIPVIGAVPGVAVGGVGGIILGGFTGAADPDLFGSPSGPLILPKNHPRDPGNDGVVYTGPAIKTPEETVVLSPPSGLPTEPEMQDKLNQEKNPFEGEAVNMCPEVDAKTPCKVLPDDPEALERIARSALCTPVTRDMFDSTFLTPIDDVSKKKATNLLESKYHDLILDREGLNTTVNPDCLAEGKTKSECSKPVKNIKPKIPENIHFDTDINSLYENARESSGSSSRILVPTAPWTSDGF